MLLVGHLDCKKSSATIPESFLLWIGLSKSRKVGL